MFFVKNNIKTVRVDEMNYIEKGRILGDSFHFEILFAKVSKFIGSKHLLTMKELQAINKKCKELGWI